MGRRNTTKCIPIEKPVINFIDARRLFIQVLVVLIIVQIALTASLFYFLWKCRDENCRHNVPQPPKPVHPPSHAFRPSDKSCPNTVNLTRTTSWPSIDPWTDRIKKEDMDYVLLETSSCSGAVESKPLHLIQVLSYTGSFERRQIIRDTWASPAAIRSYSEMFNVDVRVVFFVGLTVENVQQRLLEEKAKYGDIVQGNFIENYRNLTHKAVFVLKWAVEYCDHAEYNIRVFDDIFVNGYKLFETMAAIRTRRDLPEKVVFGFILKETEVQRQPTQKWYRTKEEYAMDVYPDFIAGYGIIMTKPVLKFLYEKAIRTKYYDMDDVFIAGLVLVGVDDVMLYNLGHVIKISDGDYARDPSCHLKSIFVHVVFRSIFIKYQWWADVLVERGLLFDDDIKRLRMSM